MKILLSAYACEPDKGSEPGVGWNWARTLVQLGHQVHLITRSNNRGSVESAMQREGLRLTVSYYDLPAWARWWKRGERGIHLYYLLWQFGIFQLARRLLREQPFDISHHISFGVFRDPSFLAFLGRPFVFGPVGGAEEAPKLLLQSFPPHLRRKEQLRSLANRVARYNPLLRAMYRRTALCLCKTPESAAVVSTMARNVSVQLEIGCPQLPAERDGGQRENSRPVRLLYVGRLLGWKGVHLAILAFAQLRTRSAETTLTIVGRGRDEAWIRQVATESGVLEQIEWIPWVAKEHVDAIYAAHDIFVFPSLHDSSGNVVLEALSHGLPVVCLDVGGPPTIASADCGAIIPTQGRAEAQVVRLLAGAMEDLAAHPQKRREAGEAARRRALQLTWTNVVAEAYQKVEQTLVASSASPRGID